MAITTQEVRKNTTGIDREFLLLVIALESDIEDMSQATADDMHNAVLKYATATGIRDQDALVKRLIAILAAYFLLYGDTLITAQKEIAVAKYDNDLKVIIPKLLKAKAYSEANDLRVAGNTLARDVALRFTTRRGFDGLTVPERIKTLQKGTERVVRNIISNEVKKGSSARQIAQKIENYVIPTTGRTRPLDEARAALKRPKSYKPQVPSGSLNSNALMIARTESSELYRDATSRFYKDKKWVTGFRWVLSNSHAHTDICNDLAEASPYDKDATRPFSHPHCVCDWRPILDNQSGLRELVRLGEIE